MSVLTDIAQLKSQIANETDANALVALYEQLVPMLQEPKVRYKDLSPLEKVAFRAKRRADRAAGIVRGRKLTEEEKAARAAKRTPEKIAAAQAKRDASRKAAIERQEAMVRRLQELEAIVAQQNSGKRK